MEENEMKEALLKLPVIEINEWSELQLKDTYPKMDRYLTLLPNGDVNMVDVLNWPPDGSTVQYSSMFLGQPELLNPAAFVPSGELNMERTAHDKIVERKNEEIVSLTNELESLKGERKKELESMAAELRTKMEHELDIRRRELEHEYEVKRLQLEADMPKRFGQGEWVSGKTLTEIIRIMEGERREK